MDKTDICVIGGGASGIIAAIAARMENPDISISILEKGDKIGRKLLATGNGRCNFTNSSCASSDRIVTFFRRLGIKAREEEQGRVYPYSGRAEDVLDAFEMYLNRGGVEIVTNFAVDKLSFSERGDISVCCGREKIATGKALLSTGGKAGPQFGCTGDGYRLAREAGHTVTKLSPALSPLECVGDFAMASGCRAKAKVSLVRKGALLHTEEGELQFGKYGLSGICVMNLSRHIRLDDCGFSDYEIVCDLTPGLSLEELVRELKTRSDEIHIPPESLLISYVPKTLAAYILNAAGTEKRQEEAARLLKGLRFTVSNVKGWQFAQCTAGGVTTSEIDLVTMESKVAKGLFFAGEIIDYDGPCGGYNLNNAWETGIKAGKAMAGNVQNT